MAVLLRGLRGRLGHAPPGTGGSGHRAERLAEHHHVVVEVQSAYAGVTSFVGLAVGLAGCPWG